MVIQTTSVPRRPAHLAWQEVAGEAVVLDTKQHVLRGLNTTGARVWDLIDGTRTVGDIAAALATERRREPGEVLADVTRFIETLLDKGLIEI